MNKNNWVTQEEFRDFKDDLFGRLDNIASQLETYRDEQTIGYHQFKELEEKVDKHEGRITTLENPHS